MQVVNHYFTVDTVLPSRWDSIFDESFEPTLAIAFVGPDYPFETLARKCEETNISLIGCTGSGETIDGQLNEHGASVMFMDIPREYFSVHQKALTSGSEEEECTSLGSQIHSNYKNLEVFVLASGLTIDGARVVKGLREGLGAASRFYGGLAGDFVRNIKTTCFTTDNIYEQGVVAIAFDTTFLELNGMAVSGWQPVGKQHQATKVEHNLILEIDHQPALSLFLSYFGGENIANIEAAKDYINPMQIPLILESGEGKGTVRSILSFHEEKNALVMAGGLAQGDFFKFCPIAKFGVMQDTIAKIDALAKEIEQPDAVILIQCFGRHYSFGPLLEDEIQSVYNVWEKPSIGFLSNGEFGPDPKTRQTTFHNITLSLMTIRER